MQQEDAQEVTVIIRNYSGNCSSFSVVVCCCFSAFILLSLVFIDIALWLCLMAGCGVSRFFVGAGRAGKILFQTTSTEEESGSLLGYS